MLNKQIFQVSLNKGGGDQKGLPPHAVLHLILTLLLPQSVQYTVLSLARKRYTIYSIHYCHWPRTLIPDFKAEVCFPKLLKIFRQKVVMS